MALPVDHLWGHVFHCATERICLLLLKQRLLTQAKVCHLDVAIRVEQNAADKHKHTHHSQTETYKNTGVYLLQYTLFQH